MTFCVVAPSINIPSPRVTLVWTDPPGQVNAGGFGGNDPSMLINDLDLTVNVEGSDLAPYYG